jgi:hypothetical protein
MAEAPPVVAGTLQTDPRSGGIKRSSGVNVLPIVAEGMSNSFALTNRRHDGTDSTNPLIHDSLIAWSEVRDDNNPSVDWIIVGYDGVSKTDITLLEKGSGGVQACVEALPESQPVFGGCRLDNGRFVTFFYCDEDTSVMQRGRASMHKNGTCSYSGSLVHAH